jgi:hypothetical protein
MTDAPDRPSLRERLRALPVLGADLPGLDVDAAPEEPSTLFVGWLEEAIDAGLPAPQGRRRRRLGLRHARRLAQGRGPRAEPERRPDVLLA